MGGWCDSVNCGCAGAACVGSGRHPANGADDGAGHLFERDHLVYNAQLYRGARHPVNHAGALVFRKGLSACGLDGFHADGAVAPHAGEQHAGKPSPCGLGGRPEKDVHRRSAVVNGRRLRKPRAITCRRSHNCEVEIARGNHAHAGLKLLVVNCFMDLVTAHIVDAVGHGL